MSHDISVEVLKHVRLRLGGQVRNLEVISRDGRIVLLGSACNYHSKQLAQHLVQKFLNVTALENQIQVEPGQTCRGERVEAD